MRRPIVIGNWKMNTTVKEAIFLVEQLKPNLKDIKNVDIVLCPPFISLTSLYPILAGSNIKLGAQNIHWEEEGAYTGEISPKMISDFCEYVILGHSERREHFSETDEDVARKIKTALENKIIPIICVGETKEQRDKGLAEATVEKQLEKDLSLITNHSLLNTLIVVYEPVWAIGTGQICKPEDATEIILSIRETISDKFTKDIAQNVRILYGGSVDSDNVGNFTKEEEIDGFLVGGASLKAEEFVRIVKKIKDKK
jgi:triosephosphate isomerase